MGDRVEEEGGRSEAVSAEVEVDAGHLEGGYLPVPSAKEGRQVPMLCLLLSVHFHVLTGKLPHERLRMAAPLRTGGQAPACFSARFAFGMPFTLPRLAAAATACILLAPLPRSSMPLLHNAGMARMLLPRFLRQRIQLTHSQACAFCRLHLPSFHFCLHTCHTPPALRCAALHSQHSLPLGWEKGRRR